MHYCSQTIPENTKAEFPLDGYFSPLTKQKFLYFFKNRDSTQSVPGFVT